MAQASTTSAPGTALVRHVAEAEPLRRIARVRHDSPYVTQLLANAADLPNMPQRRRSDRTGPLAAYAGPTLRSGRTRLIA